MLCRRLVLVLISCFCCLVQGQTTRPIATENGRVSGMVEHGVVSFKGLPYARPPLGDLRWKPPQAADSWQGVRAATRFAPACLQRGVSMPGETPPPTNEDCLYLNIWHPVSGQSLPVMVWIHGGGYTAGNAAMPLYWGDRLARRGIMVVTIAYRLGPLGYLSHPGLSDESPMHTSGNYGLMDQIAALQWVRRNIAAFGGDPQRVTIAGQSAGAMAVSTLMASPAARGLFQGAIAQSGGLFEPLQLAPGYLLANAQEDGVRYAKSLGVDDLAGLRALPGHRLLDGLAGVVSHPVIEPAVLPRSPYAVFTAGQQAEVPLLLGSNDEEARALVDTSKVTAAGFGEDINRSFGPLPKPLLEAYPFHDDASAKQARLGFERDLRFGWDMWAFARLQASHSSRGVFYYNFRMQPPFPAKSVYANWGASHYAELWYMFDHLGQANWRWTAADRQLASTMARYWTRFVQYGDPNGPALQPWPAFKAENGLQLQLGANVLATAVANLNTLSVFDKVYSEVRGSPFGETPKETATITSP